MSPPSSDDHLDELLSLVRRLQCEGTLPVRATREQIESWAYGQAKLSNDAITREHARVAVERGAP